MNVFDLIAHKGSIRQIHLTLESGFNINNRNSSLETVLIYCIKTVPDSTRRLTLLKTFVKFNPDINLQDAKGQTAFICACISQQEDTLSFLLKQPNIDVNHSDEDGYTGFMYAAESGSNTLVTILVDAHIKRQICLDIDKRNIDGKTAWQLANENHHTSLLTVFNRVDNHKQYTKPVLCVPENQNTEFFVKHSDRGEALGFNSRKSRHRNERLNLSAIRRAIKEAYLSDDEDENKNGDTNGITDLVKVVRECATDIRQIYHEQEITENKEKIEEKKVQAKTQRVNRVKSCNEDQKDAHADIKVKSDKKQTHEKNCHKGNKQKASLSVEDQPIRMMRSLNLQDGRSRKDIQVEGLKISTKRSDGGRRIVLSDTSNYDKQFAITSSTRQSYNDVTHRRVRGASSTLPLSIAGKQNKLATKLPYRKVWSSLEQNQLTFEPLLTSNSRHNLQLPPLKECFQTRGPKENPVKSLDRDMWKILQSYKS